MRLSFIFEPEVFVCEVLEKREAEMNREACSLTQPRARCYLHAGRPRVHPGVQDGDEHPPAIVVREAGQEGSGTGLFLGEQPVDRKRFVRGVSSHDPSRVEEENNKKQQQQGGDARRPGTDHPHRIGASGRPGPDLPNGPELQEILARTRLLKQQPAYPQI